LRSLCNRHVVTYAEEKKVRPREDIEGEDVKFEGEYVNVEDEEMVLRQSAAKSG
jgi:hypothetical protein